MARKKKHEEHVNAEAWAIPYGDLVTLLFALFTVMYAMSSVNEGKFRVLSDSMIAAFHGAPKSMQPVNIGEKEPGKGGDKPLSGITPTVLHQDQGRESRTPTAASRRANPTKTETAHPEELPGALIRMERAGAGRHAGADRREAGDGAAREHVAGNRDQRRHPVSRAAPADFAPAAEPVLDKLAEVLKPFPNPIRVEGHTDNRPIRTAAFPSNWELSAARAASVVHQFTRQGIDPLRLEIVGFGEFHPRQPNETVEGRNANRRVVVLVLEEVAPGAPVTARTSDRTPQTDVPGVDLADSSNAANRLLARAAPATLEKTLLIKEQAKPQPNEQPKPE